MQISIFINIKVANSFFFFFNEIALEWFENILFLFSVREFWNFILLDTSHWDLNSL